MHHIRSSKPNCKVGVPNQLSNSPEENRYINCAACLLLAELYHLKKIIYIERDAELTVFDLEDNTVMSYCM